MEVALLMNRPYRSRLQALVAFFVCSFAMHLVWENAQMRLFEIGNASVWTIFKMCFVATVTGDMLFMLILYSTVTLIHKDFWWPADVASYSDPATWLIPIIVGVLLATNFELWAVYAVHRWTYRSMPLLPFIHVGITPVLQMVVIPIGTITVCRWLANRSIGRATLRHD